MFVYHRVSALDSEVIIMLIMFMNFRRSYSFLVPRTSLVVILTAIGFGNPSPPPTTGCLFNNRMPFQHFMVSPSLLLSVREEDALWLTLTSHDLPTNKLEKVGDWVTGRDHNRMVILNHVKAFRLSLWQSDMWTQRSWLKLVGHTRPLPIGSMYGIYANMTGVYWLDLWHTIYSSTVRIRHGLWIKLRPLLTPVSCQREEPLEISGCSTGGTSQKTNRIYPLGIADIAVENCDLLGLQLSTRVRPSGTWMPWMVTATYTGPFIDDYLSKIIDLPSFTVEYTKG